MSTSSSAPPDSRPIVALYNSLFKLCASAFDDFVRHFASVDEQLDYLWFSHLPNLERWYDEQFVPAMCQYEQMVAKCAVEASKCKQFAKLYSKNDHMTNKAFEYVNKVSTMSVFFFKY